MFLFLLRHTEMSDKEERGRLLSDSLAPHFVGCVDNKQHLTAGETWQSGPAVVGGREKKTYFCLPPSEWLIINNEVQYSPWVFIPFKPLYLFCATSRLISHLFLRFLEVLAKALFTDCTIALIYEKKYNHNQKAE